MDLLLAEQVMIIGKETAAAVNHSDEYTGYTSLLAVNSADLSGLIAHAFGNTAGVQFAQAWNAQNGYLVDYAIGVVTHNDDKARAAANNLTTTFAPQFAQLINGMSHLPADLVAELTALQLGYDKALIDDVFAGNFNAYYLDLHRAYAQTSRLGDALATAIASAFPDKFPGDPNANSVTVREIVNVGLQAHSYLETMAADAALNGRDAERTQALVAITANLNQLASVVEDQRFTLALSREVSSVQTYVASNDPATKTNLVDQLATQLASVTRVPRTVVVNHENAVIRVVDDQRAKAPTLANDDRTAATSMQPIADSVE